MFSDQRTLKSLLGKLGEVLTRLVEYDLYAAVHTTVFAKDETVWATVFG